MHDIAIIGAGPAGSTAALYLAKSGFDICLIDKSEFPRDKPCGGGFAYSIIHEFPWLKRHETDFLDAICKVAILHSSNLKISLKARINLAMARRVNFDYAIFKEAISRGAKEITGSRVKKIRIKDKVALTLSNGQQITARAIIGADGVNSFVARSLGLNVMWPSGTIIPCNVCEIPMDPETLDELYTSDREYHFFANCGGEPGYGWIFPKRETVNVGIGILGNRSKGLPRKFRNFIAMLQKLDLLPKSIDLSQTRGALVPVGGTIRKTYSNRAILVGDSAGMVNPITGGGIHYAMTAAKIAASVFARQLENDHLDETSLSIYQDIWWRKFGYMIHNLIPVQRIITSDILDVLLEIGSRDSQIKQIVSNAFSEGSASEIDVRQLTFRALIVCLKSALGLQNRNMNK